MSIETDLQRAVARELDADPAVDAAEIGVSVRDGVVRLMGAVRSYAEKYSAERAARRVPGVAEVVDELVVRIGREDGHGRATPVPAGIGAREAGGARGGDGGPVDRGGRGDG